jgi:hypothetical protein
MERSGRGMTMMIMMTMMRGMDGRSDGDDEDRLLFWSGFCLFANCLAWYGARGR